MKLILLIFNEESSSIKNDSKELKIAVKHFAMDWRHWGKCTMEITQNLQKFSSFASCIGIPYRNDSNSKRNCQSFLLMESASNQNIKFIMQMRCIRDYNKIQCKWNEEYFLYVHAVLNQAISQS